MTEKEKMLAGRLYLPGGEELAAEFLRARRLTRKINGLTEEQTEEREQLFRELFGKIGRDFCIESPFRTDYGCNTYIGDFFYANYDCIIVDTNQIEIGDHVFFGPRVCVYAAGHPIDPEVRNSALEYGKPVTIGSNVWVGGNTVINPGVTIGDNVVIGSGSVVTRDVPSGVVAAGVPCRVLREITERDREYWREQARLHGEC